MASPHGPIKLREKGYGKFYWVTASRSIVWTTDRRIQIDGGLFKATFDRLAKNLSFAHLKTKRAKGVGYR